VKRAIWIGILAVLAFAVILVVRLPASWVSGALPPGVACAQMSGTVWNGACEALAVQNTALGDLQWQLHPVGLLSGALVCEFAIDGPVGTATAQVAARSGERIAVRNLRAHFALNPALMRSLPPNLRGTVDTDLALLRLTHGAIAAAEGRIDLHDLAQGGDKSSNWGDYTITFPPGGSGEPTGALRSVRAPLDLQGQVRLTRTPPGFVLSGFVTPRPDTPADLLGELGALGTPDAQGKRPVSVEIAF